MSVQLMQLTGLAHGFPIKDLVFGTSLKKSLQRQNLGLWDKIGTFLGPFSHFGLNLRPSPQLGTLLAPLTGIKRNFNA